MVGAFHKTGQQEILQPGRLIRIFIVDDDESSLSALGYRLAKSNPFHNYKVHCFSTGEECVKQLHLGPQLIIMDQYLVCNDGGSLCGAGLIRKIRKVNPEVPIVIVSGKRKPEFQLEADDDSYYYLVRNQAAFDSVKKILGLIAHPVHVL